jgi:choline-glycine betaine transporter
MNPIIFIVSVALIFAMVPLFKHMVQDCYVRAQNASHWGDKLFHWFLMGMLCVVFMTLVFAVLVIGTMPAKGRFAL